MSWILVIAVIFLALLFLFFFTKVKIKIHYCHEQHGDDFYIKFRALFGILRYTIAVPKVKLDEDSRAISVQTTMGTGESIDKQITDDISWQDIINSFENIHGLIDHISRLHTIIRNILSRVKVKKFEWHSVAGTGDAAYTGMLTGGFLGIKGSIIGMLTAYLHFTRHPSYSVTPSFGQAVFNTSLTCIFQVRIGEAILAAIKLLRYWNTEKIKIKTRLYNDTEKLPI